jgi:hypothetical protein
MWTWGALVTTALCVAPQVAAQTSGAPVDFSAPPEAPGAEVEKATQGLPGKIRSQRAAAKKDPAAIQKEIEAGIASLQAGKAGLAVQQLTAALAGGGLAGAQMAKALYHRGVAYRQQRKPARAIADLTGALWIKNGLGDSDRAHALEMRAAAYRDAGLPDQTDSDAKKLATAKAGGSGNGAAAPAPSEGTAKQAAVAAAEPSEATTAEPSSGGGLGNFFGRLFRGPSSESSVQTGAVSDSAPPTASGLVDFGGWADGTQVRKGAR